jgi:DNA polymerase-3 subunit gamma/tau
MAPSTSEGATTTPTTTPHQALYRRWRAQRFDQIVGQDAVVETLRNAVRLGRLSHGLLLVGPRGTGKTSMARIVAKAVNCLAPVDGEPDDTCEPCAAIREGRALDVVELDAASNNRVDDMRELLPRVYTAPADLRRKVFVIDEVQRIKEGWDVLLKTLEEPPDDVFFIFCTTDPSGIRPAVLSRLQRYTFRPLPPAQIEAKLTRIAAAEGRKVSPEAISLIAGRAAGGMRDGESMLDQVLSSGADLVDADGVRDLLGLAEQETVDAFVAALTDGDPLAGVRTLDQLEREGRDLVAFADQVIDRLRESLLAALSAGANAAARARLLARAAHRLAGLDTNRAAAGGYRLQLELALLESIEGPTDAQVDRPTAQVAQPAPAATQPAAAVAQPALVAHQPAPVAAQPAAAVAQPAPAAAQPAAASPSVRKPEPARTPPKPMPSEQPAPVAVAEGALLEQVQAAWPLVVERIGSNPANRPLIAACRPIEVRDSTIVLGFPEGQAFLRDIAERKRPILEEGLSAVLGRPVAVRCVASNVEVGDRLASANGEDLVAQARRVFGEDLVDVAEVE